MVKLFIGFGHRKRTGKDTAAKFLKARILEDFKEVTCEVSSFAEPLKILAHHLWGWDGLKYPEYYEGFSADDKMKPLKTLKKSPRQLWIELGLKIREIYDASWIELLLHKVESDICLIPDVRFPNEVNALRKRNAILIKIQNDSISYTNDGADVALDKYDSWDFIVRNNNLLEDFYKELHILYEENLYGRIKKLI